VVSTTSVVKAMKFQAWNLRKSSAVRAICTVRGP